jgi:peptide/nickel transport system substrate-binding protein
MSSKFNSKQNQTAKLDQLKTTDRDHLVQAVTRGMTRREAITYLTAAGVTAANAGVLFSEAGTVAAMTLKKGGTLRFANNIHGPDDQMDPVLFTSGIDYARGRTTYNSLVQHDENLTPQPELASSFEPNHNATE